MIETILNLPFMGMHIATRLRSLFGEAELQLGITELDDSVEYILRGLPGLVNPYATFLENAYIGSVSYNTQTKTYSVTGLDGAVATIQIYDVTGYGEIDLEDTFTLSGGNGSYVFDIPLPGRYMIVVWGNTKCKTLLVEV